MIGKGSIAHNSRKFHAENTVPERSHLNVEYCCENLKDVYHELFDDAVERYNAKQTRKDRCIDDYYEKIRSGKQEKLFHEVIMQIGNKDDCASDTKDGILAAIALDEYMQQFQKRNPTLRVFSAHLHVDEATPHLHIDFVPYITGSKRGVDTRVSLKQALGALGFKGGSRGDTEWNQWINAEKQQLAMVMERHGIEWEQKGTHEEHLSVLEFKKKERAKEVAELEYLLSEKREDVQELDEILKDNLAQIEVLEEEKAAAEAKANEAIKIAENSKKKVAKAKKELQEIAPLVNNVKSFALEYGRPSADLLPEAGVLESGKNYRDRKAVPFVEKMKDILFSLYRDYCDLQGKYQRLVQRYNDMWNSREYLHERCCKLGQRIDELEMIEKNYERVRDFFGADRVDNLVREMKERERIKIEQDREKRKQINRKQEEIR